MLRKTAVTVLFLTLSQVGLSGCQETEQDIIADAQYCMDEARTAAAAEACSAKLGSLQTPAAYVIRCSGEFIAQGFTAPERLVSAIDQLKGTGGTAGLLGFMAFTDNASATRAFDYCVKSNQKGMSLLAALMKTATVIASTSTSIVAGLQASPPVFPTEAEIKTAIDNVLTDGNEAVIGETVKAVYSVSCGSGSQANADVCTQIDDALANHGGAGSATPAEIGAYLLDQWKNGQ